MIKTHLLFLELDDLEAAHGGMRYGPSDRESSNVLDCRGLLCRDSKGVNLSATLQHKLGFNVGKEPPTGNGGPLGTPKVPK